MITWGERVVLVHTSYPSDLRALCDLVVSGVMFRHPFSHRLAVGLRGLAENCFGSAPRDRYTSGAYRMHPSGWELVSLPRGVGISSGVDRMMGQAGSTTDSGAVIGGMPDFWRFLVTSTLILLFLTAFATQADAQTRGRKKAAAAVEEGKPLDYTSPNFLVHTDLPTPEAKELLERLETMLKLISAYWGRPCRGVIECYVVRDLKNWPPGGIPSEIGLEYIEGGAGVTSTQTLTQGTRFIAKSVVYAVADRGTPQHEAVHAYCGQTFGDVGPVWYAEGMAEMGQYWRSGDSSVNCDPYVVEYLHATPPKSLNEIVNAQEFTGDSWQNYAWRWALCHLLAYNPNYAERFRPLGLGLLTKQPVSFEQTYGAMASEISFEYLFFLKHFDIGYRADLCRWDWHKKYIPLRGSRAVTVKVDALRG